MKIGYYYTKTLIIMKENRVLDSMWLVAGVRGGLCNLSY